MKKIIALFIAFSLMILSGNLMGKERRGTEIEIYKTKPQMEGTPWETPHIRGELIAVKKSSLLLLDSEGADVSVDINDVNFIKIMKKSKTILGAGLGLLTGVSVGALGTTIGWDLWSWAPRDTKTKYRIMASVGVISGLVSAVVGAHIGAHKGITLYESKISTINKKCYIVSLSTKGFGFKP